MEDRQGAAEHMEEQDEESPWDDMTHVEWNRENSVR